ncbi:MAG: ribonuclease Z [Calditrichaeota bacterium]|nr:MAG: ribonuclease Z [Calditrichota bacterium]
MSNSVFNLTVLGSGTCAATVKRSMSGYHVQHETSATEFLMDIGAGSLRRLLEAGHDYRKISGIFISHFHIDHIADLVPFLWASCYTPDFSRDEPLLICGPPGLKAWYKNLAVTHGDWLLELPFQLEMQEKNDEVWEWKGIKVTTKSLKHSVPVNGYRFEHAGRSLVYSGDTGYCDALIQLAENTDLLLIECSFPKGDAILDFHLTPDIAGEVARKANANKVCLTHMYPECDLVDIQSQCAEKYDGAIELAQDLRRLIV